MQEDRLNYYGVPHGILGNESVKRVVAFTTEVFITVAKLMTAFQKFLLLSEGLICCLLFIICDIFKLQPGEYIAVCV